MSIPTSDLPPLESMADAPANTLPPIYEPVGPDHENVPDDSTQDVPEYARKRPPRPVQDLLRKRGEGLKEKLGNNTKRGSGVRALTTKDRDKIANFYRMISGGLAMFRPKAARLAELSAEDAADAWMRWAQENDNTRRWLLSMMEGNAIIGVAMVNLPILLACLPDSVWEKVPPLMQGLHPDLLIALKEMHREGNDAA